MIMYGCDTFIINGSMKDSVLYNHRIKLFSYKIYSIKNLKFFQ